MKRFALLAVISLAACLDAPATSDVETELALSGRQCKVSLERTIGTCGPYPDLLVACTTDFTAACTAGGGTVWPGVPLVVNCADNSKLYHACDPKFKESCKSMGGTFGCDNVDCTEGHCTIPDGR
jgi:hypothetical protein